MTHMRAGGLRVAGCGRGCTGRGSGSGSVAYRSSRAYWSRWWCSARVRRGRGARVRGRFGSGQYVEGGPHVAVIVDSIVRPARVEVLRVVVVCATHESGRAPAPVEVIGSAVVAEVPSSNSGRNARVARLRGQGELLHTRARRLVAISVPSEKTFFSGRAGRGRLVGSGQYVKGGRVRRSESGDLVMSPIYIGLDLTRYRMRV